VCLVFSAAASKPSEWQQLRARIKTSLGVPEPLPPLRDKSYGQLPVTPDIVADRVSYATSYEMRVPALVYHKAGVTVMQHPALVIVSETRSDKSSPAVYGAGILYARAGAVVLTFDPMGQYERNSARGNSVLPQDLALRLHGLSLTDVLQAVQYLASRKDVDAARIAVIGSSLACVLDAHIRACAQTAADDQTSALKRGTVLEGDGARDMKTLALWLNDKLKFPDWTKKQIEALPLEDALVPAIARQDLHALPDAVWMAEKEDYVYDSWVERVKAGPAELKVR
jgi:hypothetical protein